MDDESQRDEMNAAIRAQRERGKVPKSMLPAEEEPPAPVPPPSEPPSPPSEPPSDPSPPPEPPKRSLFARLLGR